MQDAAIESEDGVGKFGRFRVDKQLPRHAEMNHEVPAIEPDSDKLAVALDRLYPTARQRLRGRIWRSAQHAQLKELRVENAPSYNGGPQRPHHSFDFRQLRHSIPAGPPESRLPRRALDTWESAGCR